MEEPQTRFSRMSDATQADYMKIGAVSLQWNAGLADRVLEHLKLLGTESGGYAIDRLSHSIQSATRAHRDGRDEEYVVCALLHDIGDTLASMNHSELAATILEPFVSEKNHWIVKHHGIFQGYYFFHHFGMDRDLRDRYKGHEWFADCATFCEKYDQNCFDSEYENLPLAFFEPMVRQVFAKPKRSIYMNEDRQRGSARA